MKRNYKLTAEETEFIIDVYVNGEMSYSEITNKYGFSAGTICKVVKGMRSGSEAIILSRKKGKGTLSAGGRKSLSENGKKACMRSGKFYTKPEKGFCRILNKIGIGVKYPDFIKELLGLKDDDNDDFFLFQYPIQRYVVDFADPTNKVVINVNGDYWHANPLLYDEDNLGKTQKLNIRQDKNKRIFLNNKGWTVIDVWESEILWNESEVIKRVIGVMEAHMLYTHTAKVRTLYDSPEDWSERLRGLWFSSGERKKRKVIKAICDNCKTEFCYSGSRVRVNCSLQCARTLSRKVERPSKEELAEMIGKFSWIGIGQKYSVSDNSVRKWARSYGLI